jgi:hypothetical protein
MASKSFASNVASFLTQLASPAGLPAGIEVLDPYRDPEVQRVVREMARRYYTDAPQRLSVWGINPGRFGAGITGLSFTDPWAVAHQLDIATTLTGRRELSAEFIGDVIDAYGGPQEFYRDVYLGAVSPMGYVEHGVNVNFYDTPELLRAVVPYAIACMQEQMRYGLRRDTAVVLGTGKLKQSIERFINPSVGFGQVIYLEHPRFIMQYRRSQRSAYVERYVDTLRSLRA